MYKKYKYRFKTRKEFMDEFGEDWRHSVESSFVQGMDPLLGEDISDNYYHIIDHLFKSKDILGNFPFMDIQSGINCQVSKGMIKRIDLTPTYKPKKFVY